MIFSLLEAMIIRELYTGWKVIDCLVMVRALLRLNSLNIHPYILCCPFLEFIDRDVGLANLVILVHNVIIIKHQSQLLQTPLQCLPNPGSL